MYIKKDYFDKRGIDLEIELKGSVTDTWKKEIFIANGRMVNYPSKYDFKEKMMAVKKI